MTCSSADCTFKTPENLPTHDQVLRSLEIHTNAVHNSRQRIDGAEGPILNMKVTKCVEWLASQTFEAFERDLKVWRSCSKIDLNQENMLFIEMLKKTDNDKVKDFYVKHLMNSINITQDIDTLMNKFKDKFGRSDKSEWNKVIENLKDFSWENGENTERALDRLNELRTRMTKLNVKDNLDKFLAMMFIKSGEKESNLEKAELMKIEEEIETGKFQWDVVEKTFKKYKIEQEQDKINETHYMRSNRKSRPYYASSRNENNYKNPGRNFFRSSSRDSRRNNERPRSFHRSSSRESRSTYEKPRSFHRSSSREARNPSQQRSSTPNRFVKEREDRIIVNERLGRIEKTLEKVWKHLESTSNFNNTLNETGFISNLSEEPDNEEHCVQELFWLKNEKKSIILDSGAPKSVAGLQWYQEYISENNIKDTEVKIRDVKETFKFGAGGLFISNMQVEVPFKLKDKEGTMSKVNMKICLVDHDIPFLCGRDNIENLGMMIDFSLKTVIFKNICAKVFKVRNSKSRHYVIDFEKNSNSGNYQPLSQGDVGREISQVLEEDESIIANLVTEVQGDDVYKKVRKVHRITNHKQEESMKHIYKEAGKDCKKIREAIKEVLKRCEVCQKNKKSQSIPKLSFMKPSSFNEILTLDLKEKRIGSQRRYILWIICGFSRFAKGIALNSKEMTGITKALYHGWFCNYGCPSRGLWADNGTEFSNKILQDFCRDWNISIKFGAPYSPFSNGCNERNHYSCDVVVNKLMENDKMISLQEACDIAAWTHNTNKSRKGFLPLQIATGKAVTFPGIERKIEDENIQEDKALNKGMKTLFDMGELFRRKEFKDKIELAEKTKMSKYKDEIYEIGDEVLYQEKENKEWFGPGRVTSYKSNEVGVQTQNGVKRIHPCRVARFYRDLVDDKIDTINKEKEVEDGEGESHKERKNNCKTPSILTRGMKKKVQIEEGHTYLLGSGESNESYFMNDGQRRNFLAKKIKQEKGEKSYATFLNQAKEECYIEDEVVYVVELPVKEHGRPEVVVAKEKEIENLKKYEVFQKVRDEEQVTIGTRWVITQKEAHDGQKTQVKARLVAQGFQEIDKVQSDSPTVLRESFRMFLSLAATTRIEKLRSIDIRAAFLQSDKLKRDVFVRLPKDIAEEGFIWKLQKPLYGLTDAGRRFWLRVKKILEQNGYKRVTGDEAYYFKYENGKLVGQILLHVDDFIMAGDARFVNETTKMFENALTVSKVEDDKFRFCGVDISLIDGKIIVEMEDYADSLTEIEIRNVKKTEQLDKNEMKQLRKITGKVNWLAENCRPDLSYSGLRLSTRSKNATIADLKYANSIIKKVKSKSSKLTFSPVTHDISELIVYGIGDASYKAGEKAIGGQFILLGNRKNDRVVPILWKSKLIKQVCHSPKDAETKNMVTVVDLARHAANQISQMLLGEDNIEVKCRHNNVDIKNRIPVKIFTDSLATLESIASTHQVERRLMRSSIADLKQKLEEKEVECYSWLQDEDMVADILTKDMRDKFGLDEIVKENRFRCVTSSDNTVTIEGGEFVIKGRKLKDKMKK